MTSESRPGRDSNALAARLTALLDGAGLHERADAVSSRLIDQYSQPQRLYHDLGHIRQCLGVLDEVREHLHDPEAVELAIWFHDAVFDLEGDDNELRSALLFDQYVGVHLPTDRADRIHTMIMDTVHPSGPESRDACFMADIDLSSLALPWPEFVADSADLRREASHLSDQQYRDGKLAFFRSLLSRPGFYLTDYFREHHADQARRNLEAVCAELEDPNASPGA